MALSDLTVCTIYTVFTLGFAEILRLTFRSKLKDRSPFLHQCIQEFIAAFELCAVCFEIGILYTEYGLLMYSIYLFLASVWWSLRWGDATGAPYTHIEDWVSGANDLNSVSIIIASELAGGMIFYRLYLAPLWSISQSGIAHVSKLDDEFCFSDIQVPVVYAALIEGGGIFILQLIVKLLIESTWRNEICAVIESLISTIFVAAAFTTSGGYFNPVLATACQYGCIGSTVFDHVLVYWVAEILGAILALYVWNNTSISNWAKPKTD